MDKYCTILTPDKAHGHERGKVVKTNRKGVFVELVISWMTGERRTVCLKPHEVSIDTLPVINTH